ncbi:MAG: nitroreductase family protein [Prevotella sp.]|jgi:nitroreductase|nr:nitroreductase family protein [Prevotella sp.]MBQ1588923.1 nitroreductase family protein [Prevotella sp.]MBQ1646067.1 nitroreductase family protein [Prevotella sp.]MBQ1667783.1 nitroreductase family protein [Prevotella sp.]MBQ1700785.1 nitroreductase family protein [Prevotella sp.]
MKSFKDLVQLRRSHRKFTDQPLTADEVKTILRAALMSPTSKNRRAWHFVVVEDKTDLQKLADAKELYAEFVGNAPLAVVVTANPEEDECWMEDCAIAAISMQYQAEDLGLGSCWAQMKNYTLSDGTSTEDVIRGILDIPENQRVLCVLAFGHKADERKPQNEDRLKWENVHIDKFTQG